MLWYESTYAYFASQLGNSVQMRLAGPFRISESLHDHIFATQLGSGAYCSFAGSMMVD